MEVHDARFSKQAQNFYRLKMGSYQYADGIFPLGGRHGEQVAVTMFGAHLASPVKITADLRAAPEKQSLTEVRLPGSPALPFLFAVSDLPEVIAPLAGAAPLPGVINGRLEKPGATDRYRFQVEPGSSLLFELEARELGTSRLEGIITAYDASGKKLDSAGDKPLPEDFFAVQGTSRTSSDPFLNLKVPEGVHEIGVTVEDLAQRGGPLYGYRLTARKAAEDFRVTVNSPYVNIPAGGTVAISASVDRRGYDGPVQLAIPDLPKGLKVEGGFIPREYVDTNKARAINRRGVLTITAEAGVELPPRELSIWGEGKLASGEVLRRRARGSGAVIDVAGATAQGVVDRQRPLTAYWLGMELPAAVGERAPATLEVRQTAVKQMAEGARYEFEFVWKFRARGLTPPRNLNVDPIGARDIRVIDMKRSEGLEEDGTARGSFVVTTTKATDPARYDLLVSGRLRTENGDEVVVARPIPFEVTGEGSSGSNVASSR